MGPITHTQPDIQDEIELNSTGYEHESAILYYAHKRLRGDDRTCGMNVLTLSLAPGEEAASDNMVARFSTSSRGITLLVFLGHSSFLTGMMQGAVTPASFTKMSGESANHRNRVHIFVPLTKGRASIST